MPPDSRGIPGASGHILTDTTYWAINPSAIAETIGYKSARQAIVTILKAFAPARFNNEADTKRRQRGINDTLKKRLPALDFEELSLTDIESEEGPPKTRSIIFNRNAAIYIELRQAIQDYSQQLGDLIYLTARAELALATAATSGDPGRQFLGWFKEHFKEEQNVPAGIVAAYQNLTDPLTNLTPEEERFLTRGLVAYQRLHTYVRTNIALKPIEEDLSEYERLPSQHRLANNPAIERARIKLAELQGDRKMTISQFSVALDLASLSTLRREINRETLAPFLTEFTEALNKFRFVAYDDKGAVHEDLSSESVPLNRLKQHIYGAAIGVSSSSASGEKRALITREEFQALRTAHFHLLADPQNEKILSAIPISAFRDIVKLVIVANRKAKYLDNKLANYCADRGIATTELVAANGAINGDNIASWQPVLPVDKGYLPAEDWLADILEVNPDRLPLDELAKRVNGSRSWILSEQRIPEKRYADRRIQIEELSLLGLYHADDKQLWSMLADSAKKLTPAGEVRGIIERATRIIDHPLVTYPRLNIGYERPLNEVIVSSYLLPMDLFRLNKLLALEGALREIDKTLARQGVTISDMQQLAMDARLRELNTAQVFVGGVVSRGPMKQLELQPPRSFREILGAQERPDGPQGVFIYPFDKVRDIGVPLAKGGVMGGDLASEWVSAAKRLCTLGAKDELARAGFIPVETGTFLAARSLSNLPNVMISEGFLNGVNLVLNGVR